MANLNWWEDPQAVRRGLSRERSPHLVNPWGAVPTERLPETSLVGGEVTGNFFQENKGPLAIAGGSLLAGLTGQWAESQAKKDEDKRLEGMERFAFDPNRAATGLSSAVRQAAERQPAPIAPQVRQTGQAVVGTSLSKAAGTLSRGAESSLAEKAMRPVEQAVAVVRQLERSMNMARTETVGRGIVSEGAIKGAVGRSTADFMRAQTDISRRNIAEAGDAWRGAINGLTQMAAAVMTMGTSPALQAAQGAVAGYQGASTFTGAVT